MRYGLILVVVALPMSILAQPEPEVRGKKASEWVEILTRDADARRREGAVLALGVIGAKSRLAVPALGMAVRKDAAASVRLRAARTLAGLGKNARDAVADLADTLRDDTDSTVREAAAQALSKLGEVVKPAIPTLIRALKDPEPSVRAAAAESLGRLGAEAHTQNFDWIEAIQMAGPDLLPLLDDRTARVRVDALFALARIRPTIPVAAAIGKRLLEDESIDVRKEAAQTIRLLGPSVRQAVPALAEALARKETPVELRQTIVLALAEMGEAAADALPQLTTALSDPDKSVRCHAIAAIGRSGKSSLVSLLPILSKRLMEDESVEVRLAIIQEIAELGPEGKPALPALMTALRDPRLAVRESAALAIQKISP